MDDNTSGAVPFQLPLPTPVEIPISNGYIVVVDPVDADLINHHWSAIEIYRDSELLNVYAHRWETVSYRKRIHILLHRLVLGRTLGRPLVKGEEVDHIDGNGLNNQRKNLRLATRGQNTRNTRKQHNNTSGYKGVIFDKSRGKWQARIQVNHKLIHLGRYDSPADAYAAYCEAASLYFGEFARLD